LPGALGDEHATTVPQATTTIRNNMSFLRDFDIEQGWFASYGWFSKLEDVDGGDRSPSCLKMRVALRV
jgi:hypothetical protein